jgi:hypothetical protein
MKETILKDYAARERVNRICQRWADRTAKQFRILDFKTLKRFHRLHYRWTDVITWQQAEQYKAKVASLGDRELRHLTA